MPRKWTPPLIYPVPRGAQRKPAIPVFGDPSVFGARGVIAALSLSGDQTEDFSTEAQIDWNQADYDPYDMLSFATTGQWSIPLAMNGHVLLAVCSYHMSNLTGLGSEFASFRATGNITALSQQYMEYGPSAVNQGLQQLVLVTTGGGDPSTEAIWINADSGSDTSATITAGQDTWLRIFDLGLIGKNRPKGNSLKAVTLQNDTEDTLVNISAGHVQQWESAPTDTDSFFDPCSPGVITIPAGMEGWSCIISSQLSINDLGDQGYHAIEHFDACAGAVGRSFSYFQHGGIGSGTSVRNQTTYAHHCLQPGDTIQRSIDSEPGDTSVTLPANAFPNMNATFFPPVEGLVAPTRA